MAFAIFLIDFVVDQVQQELQEREEELLGLRKRAHEAESARDVALSTVDALKQALGQLDRELKATRAQQLAQRGGGGRAETASSARGEISAAQRMTFAGSPTTTVVSALSPPREEHASSSAGSGGGISGALLAHQEHGALLQRELEAAQRGLRMLFSFFELFF